MEKRYLSLANSLSLSGASFGLLAIIELYFSNLLAASLLILLAVLLDFLDGKVARKTGTAGDFGKNIDSLSDIVSFGVAPALMAWQLTANDLLGLVGALLILSAGIFRLARYNTLKIKDYLGMPIPFNALIFVAAYLSGLEGFAVFLLAIMSALLMASTFKIKKRF
ncbi:MAG TPA: CDP-diacylglycerol--serine O-phosphatidyltransferase [archaeon]|nr:CDP-diacylglycerol--serine O-phosphatidyltransferase [archaeon]